MFVPRNSTAILGAIVATLLSSQSVLAIGSSVHAGKTCQALHDKCIARAVKAPEGSLLTLSACDDALKQALATPVKSTDPGRQLYVWPQMGPTLPEKCTN